jgi:hypothetical protein
MRRLALLITPLALAMGPLGPATADTTPYVVTTFIAPNLTLGQSLPVHGRVSPSARGKYVYVEARSPGLPVWETRRAVMVRKGGRYSAVLHPNEPGVWRYRVVKPGGGGHRRGVSAVRIVSVWRWRPLEPMLVEYDGSGGTTPVGSVTIAGRTFSPGYQQDPAGARFFALKRRCSRIDAWVGADPASATDDPATAQILGSDATGVDVFDRTLASVVVHRSDPAPVHLVVSAAVASATVNLELKYDNGTDGNRLLWGAPRAYCLF